MRTDRDGQAELEMLAKVAAEADAAGIRVGAFIGCGHAGGCVFAKAGASSRVYKILIDTGNKCREVEVVRRLMMLPEVHPAIVKNFGAWTFLVDPKWGNLSYSVNVIERERLDFEDERADAILNTLANTETALIEHGIFDASAMIRRVKPDGIRTIIERAVAEMEASDLGDGPTPKWAADGAVRVLDALVWLYRTTGIVMGDLWAVGLGMGYGTKPDNLGFRGKEPVISDLGVWKEHKPPHAT